MGKVRLNEDREVVALIQEGLKRTGGSWPSRRDPQAEHRCLRDELKAQTRDPHVEGYCHCRLYYKEK